MFRRIHRKVHPPNDLSRKPPPIRTPAHPAHPSAKESPPGDMRLRRRSQKRNQGNHPSQCVEDKSCISRLQKRNSLQQFRGWRRVGRFFIGLPMLLAAAKSGAGITTRVASSHHSGAYWCYVPPRTRLYVKASAFRQTSPPRSGTWPRPGGSVPTACSLNSSRMASRPKKRKQQEFFELAERFRTATDPKEAERLGDELGRMVLAGNAQDRPAGQSFRRTSVNT